MAALAGRAKVMWRLLVIVAVMLFALPASAANIGPGAMVLFHGDNGS